MGNRWMFEFCFQVEMRFLNLFASSKSLAFMSAA